jgi:hypothetical protein
LGNCLAPLAIDIGDHQLGAFFGKPARIGSANAVRGAGNNDDFIVQSHGASGDLASNHSMSQTRTEVSEM